MHKEPFFKRIYVEITNVCNQNCPFCPGTTRTPQFMTEENFCLILKKLQGHTKHLYFHVLGEPLLHPKIALFLDEAQAKGFQVNLVTTGAMIEQIGQDLLNKPALRQISFSLHSLAHQGAEITQQRLNQILNFVDEATKHTSIYCSLRLWTGGIKANQIVLNRLANHFSLDLNTIIQTDFSRGVPLAKRVFLNPAQEFIWPSLQGKVQPGLAFCYGLRHQLAILVDGTVVPCCLDGEGDIPLGNILETELKELWQKKRSQAIIDGFTQGRAVEPLCQKCGYRTRFTKK